MALIESRSISGDLSDKRYESDGIAEYFRRIIDSGVFSLGTNLQVAVKSGLDITVNYGEALNQGYLIKVKNNNTGALTFRLDSGSSLPRIDRVVIQKNAASQSVDIVLKKGSPASSPSPPPLSTTAQLYEVGLASITVNANATSVSGIVDDRKLISMLAGTNAVPFAAMPFIGSAPLVENGTVSGIGYYYKFADGTMIQTRNNVIVAVAANSNGVAVELNYPLPFVGVNPTVVINGGWPSGSWDYYGITGTGTTLSTFKFIIRNGPVAQNISGINVLAIGRWK